MKKKLLLVSMFCSLSVLFGSHLAMANSDEVERLSSYQFQLNADETVEFYSFEMVELISFLDINVSDCRDQRGVRITAPAEFFVKNSRSSQDVDLQNTSVEGRFHFRNSVNCTREAMQRELMFIFSEGAHVEYSSHRPMVENEVCGTFGGGCRWVRRPAPYKEHRLNFEALNESDLPRSVDQINLRLEFKAQN